MVAALGFGTEPRAPWAVDPATTRGRLYPETSSPTRTPYQRDRDRIIHSTAFRRLKHKTQVFVYHEGDHFRTRLTHTIEVAQIARALARALRLDEDLAEALALAHDLGHTPFGHTGEDALDACLDGFGGFDHNAHSLRIVTSLERRYAEFDGLNLAWETLEGLVKHNGPLTDPHGNPVGRYAERGLPHALVTYPEWRGLDLHTFASAEAQAAAIADDIAYDAHDIDDGLRAGLLALEDFEEVPLVGDFLRDIRRRYPGLDRARTIHELTRRLITAMVEDVIATGIAGLETIGARSAADVRAADRAVVVFSPAMAGVDRAIKEVLFPRLYRHPEVMRVRRDAERVVRDLFGHYVAAPDTMPEEWCAGLADCDSWMLARRVGDYIAGMTDRFAIQEHRRRFAHTPELR
ncbi:deoxyguanosinetriphosphate triphosphohydrolase [Oharaeibacter diazotrophicus]|uniref:Deoxyguanosinetriphosphate triphosphohydrolase-like protein n=1 Tax=Oharaeibacter diazotrophicus TaxID=1920512 RepID=A0A4R6RL67_9HYPH|nr:deoxyguanosinetriphosphate triphosphohydrolase [Oharaeibacter diazotrophicus]TDP86456.1 dGTPase [Oharaeibacter diazotrophicus]BBE71602.1 deoxyguanosinetriphosphate triphosphohydrolase [Pleomorphomonas sp. SM30]GLS78364.1 deoxyguanosinetriphosphate triphosphohydrolase-like protein [Oharaeibacter diazotrophicus]